MSYLNAENILCAHNLCSYSQEAADIPSHYNIKLSQSCSVSACAQGYHMLGCVCICVDGCAYVTQRRTQMTPVPARMCQSLSFSRKQSAVLPLGPLFHFDVTQWLK